MGIIRRTNRSSTRRGVAAAELAVCLPVVVLLVVATIESCSALFLKQSLTVAAYEGVRTAIEKGSTTANVQTACDQILADRRIQGAASDRESGQQSCDESGRLYRRDGERTVHAEFAGADDVFPRPNADGQSQHDDRELIIRRDSQRCETFSSKNRRDIPPWGDACVDCRVPAAVHHHGGVCGQRGLDAAGAD